MVAFLSTIKHSLNFVKITSI